MAALDPLQVPFGRRSTGRVPGHTLFRSPPRQLVDEYQPEGQPPDYQPWPEDTASEQGPRQRKVAQGE